MWRATRAETGEGRPARFGSEADVRLIGKRIRDMLGTGDRTHVDFAIANRMNHFEHPSGALYHILDGVRRAKAAQMLGHADIRAEVIGESGQSLGEGEIPIKVLRSPKTLIRRLTSADETRWSRVLAGAQEDVLSFPPITVQPSRERGTRIEDVGFDFGGDL